MKNMDNEKKLFSEKAEKTHYRLTSCRPISFRATNR